MASDVCPLFLMMLKITTCLISQVGNPQNLTITLSSTDLNPPEPLNLSSIMLRTKMKDLISLAENHPNLTVILSKTGLTIESQGAPMDCW